MSSALNLKPPTVSLHDKRRQGYDSALGCSLWHPSRWEKVTKNTFEKVKLQERSA